MSSSPYKDSPEPGGILYILFAYLGGLFLFSWFSKTYSAKESINNTGRGDRDPSTRRLGPSSECETATPQKPQPPATNRPTGGEQKPWYKKGWKLATLLINFLTLLAVTWYACLASDQSNSMRQSVESQISGSRAWIVPEAPPQKKPKIEEANLEWRNAGKTPAVSVFSMKEYFTGEFPLILRSCEAMEKELKKTSIDQWQYQGFVADGGRYEIGLDHAPAWVGQAPIAIHGCVWYTDVLSGKERSTEFFYQAFQNVYGFPKADGISVFYLSDRPFIYR
jgi:hypothetical protein